MVAVPDGFRWEWRRRKKRRQALLGSNRPRDIPVSAAPMACQALVEDSRPGPLFSAHWTSESCLFLSIYWRQNKLFERILVVSGHTGSVVSKNRVGSTVWIQMRSDARGAVLARDARGWSGFNLLPGMSRRRQFARRRASNWRHRRFGPVEQSGASKLRKAFGTHRHDGRSPDWQELCTSQHRGNREGFFLG